jgi:hypothetical protein
MVICIENDSSTIQRHVEVDVEVLAHGNDHACYSAFPGGGDDQ